MISLIAKKNIQYNDVYACLSTDTKEEEGYGNGDVMIEMDTSKMFMFNEDGSAGSKWIELVIEDQDVDVHAGRHDMVKAAVADIVSPAIAADHPDGLFGQAVLTFAQEVDVGAVLLRSRKGLAHRIGERLGLFAVVALVQPGLQRGLQRLVGGSLDHVSGVHLALFAHLLSRKADTEGKLGVILKQRV